MAFGAALLAPAFRRVGLRGFGGSRASIALEEEVFSALSGVVDPLRNNASIRSLGYVKGVSAGEGGGRGTIHVTLPSAFHPHRRSLLSSMSEALPPGFSLDVTYKGGGKGAEKKKQAPSPAEEKGGCGSGSGSGSEEAREAAGPGLSRTSAVVAVYSCKGGVGKSTVSANLAYALAKREGLKVGLLDCDVYGPSLPTLLSPRDVTVRRSSVGKMVMPIDHHGVKLLSLAYVSPKSGVPGAGSATTEGGVDPAVIRGPMASRVVTQLLKGTDWGNLDILLLDLPPGTGDVQLTVCQEIVLDGAVAVTTP